MRQIITLRGHLHESECTTRRKRTSAWLRDVLVDLQLVESDEKPASKCSMQFIHESRRGSERYIKVIG